MSPNLNTGCLGLGITIMLCAATLGTAIYLYSPYYGHAVILYGGILGCLIAAIEIMQDVRRGK